jgi:hypothetical protein
MKQIGLLPTAYAWIGVINNLPAGYPGTFMQRQRRARARF